MRGSINLRLWVLVCHSRSPVMPTTSPSCYLKYSLHSRGNADSHILSLFVAFLRRSHTNSKSKNRLSNRKIQGLNASRSPTPVAVSHVALINKTKSPTFHLRAITLLLTFLIFKGIAWLLIRVLHYRISHLRCIPLVVLPPWVREGLSLVLSLQYIV